MPSQPNGRNGDQLPLSTPVPPTTMTISTTATMIAVITMLAFAVMRIPRISSSATNATIAIAGRFTTPPSALGGPEIDAGSVTPKIWSSVALRYADQPTDTAEAPTMNSSARSQPMTNATSSPSLA